MLDATLSRRKWRGRWRLSERARGRADSTALPPAARAVYVSFFFSLFFSLFPFLNFLFFLLCRSFFAYLLFRLLFFLLEACMRGGWWRCDMLRGAYAHQFSGWCLSREQVVLLLCCCCAAVAVSAACPPNPQNGSKEAGGPLACFVCAESPTAKEAVKQLRMLHTKQEGQAERKCAARTVRRGDQTRGPTAAGPGPPGRNLERDPTVGTAGKACRSVHDFRQAQEGETRCILTVPVHTMNSACPSPRRVAREPRRVARLCLVPACLPVKASPDSFL